MHFHPFTGPPEVRLVGGNNEYEGLLEIRWNGVWGTVCDDGFGNVDAAVVCRQLGYSADNAIAFGNGYFGQGNGTIWLDDVQCVGTESFLYQCPAAELGDHNCAHFEDVGIRCGGKKFSGLLLYLCNVDQFQVVELLILSHLDCFQIQLLPLVS